MKTTDPHPGFYRTRLVRGGPWVPVAIDHGPSCDPVTGEILDRPWLWRMRVGADELPAFPDPGAAGILDRWPYLEPITEAEYRYLAACIDWAARHAPSAPEASPRQRIDHLTTRILF